MSRMLRPRLTLGLVVALIASGPNVSSAEASASSGGQALQQLSLVLSDNTTCQSLPESGQPGLKNLCEAMQLCQDGSDKSGNPELNQLCSALAPQADPLTGVANKPEQKRNKKPHSASVWGYGILCVTIISMMSVMGVAVLPFMSKSFYNSMLTSLIGLAVGSLSGSALFHLIPSAFSLSDVSFFPHHSYLNVAMVVWLGVYGFFIIERLLKIIMEFKSKNKSSSLPKHGHSHINGGGVGAGGDTSAVAVSLLPGNENAGNESRELILEQKVEASQEMDSNARGCGQMGTNQEVYEHSQQAIRASFGHMDRPAKADRGPTVTQVKSSLKQSSPIATVAWMIIFGDGVHNFIDGLSIGAAFSESILTGISVSVAVLCEEFPHELGDFAVLLNSGMTMRQAMFYNFLSACTCYLGLVIGIVLGEMHMGNEYIFALAGGMFLYIALVDMVPELNEETDKASKISLKRSMFTFLMQNVGMAVGIVCLFVLAKYQDQITIEL